MYANQLRIYESVSKAAMSGREVEAAVLTKAALKLKDCQDNWQAEDRRAKLHCALKFNQLMWSIFQAELLKSDNPLPKKLRQDILNLSVFIDKRIFEAMAGPSPEKLTDIININLRLAAGLKLLPS